MTDPTHDPGVALELAPDLAGLVPVQRQGSDDLEHERAHELGRPYLGCPACVAAGVFLCPGCERPGPGAQGLGWHTRCLPVWRLFAFALYVLLAVAAVAGAVLFAFAFRTVTFAGATAGLLAALLWPYRYWLVALRVR